MRAVKERQPVAAVIACAMEEELAPFLDEATELELICDQPQPSYRGQLLSREVVFVQSGIGLTNAAVAATRILEATAPQMYIAAGSTGGLAASVKVRDQIVGTSACYFDADATAFGYAPGQIPQMPAVYRSGTGAEAVEGARRGQVLSGNSFVTAANVAQARSRFPDALAVDMETAAIAQTCHLFSTPWVSLRTVSDLCGPEAGQEFHIGLETAALLSFQATCAYLSSTG